MKTIAVLAYPDCQILDVVGPLQVFATANRMLATSAYEVAIVAESAGPVLTNAGLPLIAARGIDTAGEIDTLLVAGGMGVDRACREPRLLRWLADIPGRVRRVGSVCTGAFLLAAAGLLDGRRVVTHWRECARLARAYPRLHLEPDALYLCDGGIYSSAGVTAGIDLALALLREDQGHRVAMAVARELVVFMHRPGGQSQFSTALVAHEAVSPPLQRAVEQVRRTPTARLTLEALAARAAVSPRHLSRLFRRELHLSAGDFIERVRLELAQSRLEEGADSLAVIARQCGFGCADTMRRIFVKRLGINPSDYRERFAHHRPAGRRGAS